MFSKGNGNEQGNQLDAVFRRAGRTGRLRRQRGTTRKHHSPRMGRR
nr:MAG TPA: hypothetical protein [Caudoviricetes sp.]